MTRARMSLMSAWWLMTCALGAAQQPTRDATTVNGAVANPARIAGLVVSADNPGQPVHRVIVALSGGELPGGRAAITDDEGRFAFENLPPGRFTLSATKPAYLPTSYGAAKPGRPGIPLQVAAGQTVTGVTLTISRGAAIAGAVRDQTGQPAANVQVLVLRSPPPGTGDELMSAASTTTDDRGSYRVYGLMPGEYFIASTVRSLGAPEINVTPAADVDAALRDLQQHASSSTMPVTPPPRPAAYAYAPVFFPGVTSAAAATKIKIGAGEERTGIDFTMTLARVATIDGTIVLASGDIPNVVLVINPDGPSLPAITGLAPALTVVNEPDGRHFRYTSVGPGRYTIIARSTSSSPPSAANVGGRLVGNLIAPPTATPVSWARADVDVAGEDISGLTLQLQPAMRFGGRVVFEGSTLTPPADVTGLRINIAATNFLGSMVINGMNMGTVPAPPALVQANGRFEINGVLPGAYRVTVAVPRAPGWWLKSAVINGRDVLDTGLEFGTANIADAVLTLSDRHTTLSGTLQSAPGQPQISPFIVVFPADRSLWRPQARRIQSTRAGSDGTWTVHDLPPGDYLIAALGDLDAEDLLTPSFFDALVNASAKVTLGDGEQKVQDLRIGGERPH